MIIVHKVKLELMQLRRDASNTFRLNIILLASWYQLVINMDETVSLLH